MKQTTADNMNFLTQKDDNSMGFRLPKKMRTLLKRTSKKLGMNESVYVKVAIQERLEKDL